MVFIKELQSNDFENLNSSTMHQNIFELPGRDSYVFPETTFEGYERLENILQTPQNIFEPSTMDSIVFPDVSTHEGQSQTHQNVFELPKMDSNVLPTASTQEGQERMENMNVAEALDEVNPSQQQVEEFQPQVTKHIKEMVLQAVGELKRLCEPLLPKIQEENNVIIDAIPISFRLPQATDPKRSKTKLLMDITRSFTLPAQLLAGHEDDLDNFPVPTSLLGQLTPDFKYKKRYTFTQRLENWKLLCKQRVNTKIDFYYKHGKSNEFFRSTVEVVNFIMYEICPRHLVKIARGTPIAEPSSHGTEGKKRSYLSAQFSHDVQEGEMKAATTQEEAVKVFLKEAYENLQNLFKNENRGESSSKATKSQGGT